MVDRGKRNMISRIHTAIVLSIAAGAAFWLLFLRSPVESSYLYTDTGISIPVSIADTPIARARGLSGTQSLPQGTGKLFIFDTPDVYGFWMKDMRYSLDIVWIDSAWQVVGVTLDVAPETYPTTFFPPSAVQYVLELNTGDTSVDTLSVGTKLTFVRQ
jgi:uncharacterized membrane protein (UPF0127 family)